jgi:hypothetical protein
MTAETQKPKFDLKKTGIEQNFEMPLDFEGEKYVIYGTYKQQKKGNERKKTLEIAIPDIRTPNGKRGLSARFERDEQNKKLFSRSAEVKGHRQYWQTPEIKKFFEDYVQPVLKENLYKHITKLIKFYE